MRIVPAGWQRVHLAKNGKKGAEMNLCWKANSTVATSSDAASLRGLVERISRFIFIVVINVVAGSSSSSSTSTSAASVRQKITKNPEQPTVTTTIVINTSPKTRLQQIEGQHQLQLEEAQHSYHHHDPHHQPELGQTTLEFLLQPSSSVADGDPGPAAVVEKKLAAVGFGKKLALLLGVVDEEQSTSTCTTTFIPFTSQSSALFLLQQFVVTAIFLALLNSILVAVLHYFSHIAQLLLGVLCLVLNNLSYSHHLLHLLRKQSATFRILRNRLKLSLFVLQKQVEKKYPSSSSLTSTTDTTRSTRTTESIGKACSSSQTKLGGNHQYHLVNNSFASPSVSLLLEWITTTTFTTNVIEPFCGRSLPPSNYLSSPSTADLIGTPKNLPLFTVNIASSSSSAASQLGSCRGSSLSYSLLSPLFLL
ncbi:unnamed protein product [Orchesella dallaii]|uniref:Uncharacterized protein n=1 Tax=Orchesella dallaii TaxID=48710 RepID=A0ABP1S4U8_9HEXA